MAERATELEQVGPFAEMDRGEGVAKRVERRPRRAGLLDQGLEDATAQVVGADHLAGPIGKGGRGRVEIALRGEMAAEFVDERRRQPHVAPAVLGLRRLDPPFDDCPPDADLLARSRRAGGAGAGGRSPR